MQYYGTRLSENISKREPEGYLLCLNVPVARTGIQEYLPAELGLTGNGLVPVSRPISAPCRKATPTTCAEAAGRSPTCSWRT